MVRDQRDRDLLSIGLLARSDFPVLHSKNFDFFFARRGPQHHRIALTRFPQGARTR